MSSKVFARLEIITPAKARKMLERNTNNRKVNKSHVAALARDIKNGHWFTNGQTICFDCNGVLTDGQHRLLAIILSGVTVESLVAYNVAPDACQTYGSEVVRSFRAVQEINGIKTKNSATFGAAAMLLPHYEEQRFGKFFRYSQIEKLGFIEDARWAGLGDTVNKVMAIGDKLFKKAWLIAAAHIVGEAYPDKKDEIVHKLATGEMVARHEPVYRLRAWVNNNNNKMGGGNDCRSIGFYTALKMLEMQAKGAHASRVTIAREAFKVGK